MSIPSEFCEINRLLRKIQLHMMYEMGELDEETYAVREEELLNRYKIAKEREKNGV